MREEERAPASGPGALGARSPRESPNGCAGQDPFLSALLEGIDQADAFELDTRLRRALAAEQQRSAQMGPWLLAVARGRLYRTYGCASLGEFARESSPAKAEALLRLERACQIAPALRDAYRAGRLSWARAQELVR